MWISFTPKFPIQDKVKIRLLRDVRMDGMIYSQGIVLSMPRARAAQFIRDGWAVPLEPEKAVMEAPEKR
jgi:hypothetical protein